MERKIGLVIQGPLFSIGRTGDKMHESVEELKNEGGLVEYDCRGNIRRIISEFGHLFDEVVISTWNNEVTPEDAFIGAKLISAPDPGGIKQIGHYKDNNKQRQFVSTLNGLLELEKSGMDYAVKIRTDIYLDLEKLINSFFSTLEKRENKQSIGTTVIHPATYLLHDLYFISDLKALKEFCESIIAYDKFEFIQSVHRDMLLKHAYKEYKDKIGVPDWAYFPVFPPGGVSGSTRKIFDYMFENVYFSLDPEIFRATLWRGTYFEKKHVSSLVDRRKSVRRYNIPALISIDWERYFNFRKEVLGGSIKWVDKILIWLGSKGWVLWDRIRWVGRALV